MLRGTLGFILAICALALAASCVSPEELRHEDEAACTGYGFKAGTNEFANCLQRESLARDGTQFRPLRRHLIGDIGDTGAAGGGHTGHSGMDAC